MFGVVQGIANGDAKPDEPPAGQVLRRLSPTRRTEATAAISSLPALGRGTALPDLVRRPMEIIMGRSFGSVEIHESPVAETLGAEAFTSGQRIVFAPGRLDFRSTRGLALVGHELTHIGQPLAFKESSGPGTSDSAESAARQQEADIERIIEQGWPNVPRMDVVQATQALRTLVAHGGAAGAPPGAGAGGGGVGAGAGAGAASPAGGVPSAGGTQTLAAGGGGAGASAAGADSLPAARLSEAPAAPGGGGAGGGASPDVEKLAVAVYDIVKSRLRAERTRYQVY